MKSTRSCSSSHFQAPAAGSVLLRRGNITATCGA